jgi:hypothetical protein
MFEDEIKGEIGVRVKFPSAGLTGRRAWLELDWMLARRILGILGTVTIIRR